MRIPTRALEHVIAGVSRGALLGALAFAFCSCVGLSNLKLPAPAVVHDVRVEVTGLLRQGGLGGGIAGFRGEARNQSRETLKFCTVTLELLDSSGAKIGNALATTQHLAPGVPWKFDAYCTAAVGTRLDSVTLVDVQTDKSLFEGMSSGARFDSTTLKRLKPGETTLAQAVEILGGEPLAKNYGPDGSITAVWSHVAVKASGTQSRQATIQFDAKERMVRVLNETSSGPGR